MRQAPGARSGKRTKAALPAGPSPRLLLLLPPWLAPLTNGGIDAWSLAASGGGTVHSFASGRIMPVRMLAASPAKSPGSDATVCSQMGSKGGERS